MMREDYSEALVEGLLLEIDAQQSQVDREAEKRFYDALGERPGYIDVEAFHKAYDALIKEAGMADIFDEDGIIAGKWLYGRIKECANAQAARALKRLWVAQYVDRLKTSKQIEAQKAAENEAEERVRKAAEEREQKRQSIRDAANAAKEKALQALDPKLVAAYKLAAETDDIADDIYVEPQFGYGAEEAIAKDYQAGVKGQGYYWLKQKDLGNTKLLADRITNLLEKKIVAISADFARNMAVDTIRKLGINEIRHWQAGYLIIDGLVYKVALQNGVYTFEVEKGAAWATVTKDVLPDMSKAKVAAVSAEIYHSEGTCWVDTITHIYYNPEMPGDVLDKCGILPEDASHWEGAGNGLDIKALAAKDIPAEAHALGLTAGESQHYEHDSSD